MEGSFNLKPEDTEGEITEDAIAKAKQAIAEKEKENQRREAKIQDIMKQQGVSEEEATGIFIEKQQRGFEDEFGKYRTGNQEEKAA